MLAEEDTVEQGVPPVSGSSLSHQYDEARQMMIPSSGDSAPTVMYTGVCPGNRDPPGFAEESQRDSRRLILVSQSQPVAESGADSHEAMLRRVRERITAPVVESGSDTDSVDFGRELDEGSVASGEEEPTLTEEVVEVEEVRATPAPREALRSLDEVNLEDVFRRRATVLKTVPACLRGPFRNGYFLLRPILLRPSST